MAHAYPILFHPVPSYAILSISRAPQSPDYVSAHEMTSRSAADLRAAARLDPIGNLSKDARLLSCEDRQFAIESDDGAAYVLRLSPMLCADLCGLRQRNGAISLP